MYGLSIDAEDALMEYLETFYHLGIAGKALDRFGAVDFATSIAPGLRDVLLTGKVYEAVRRGLKRPAQRVRRRRPGRPADRADRPVPQRARGGRRAGQGWARSATRPIRSCGCSAPSTTVVHLVTLLEDMPVTETEEAVAALQPTQIRIGTVIENMVGAEPARSVISSRGGRRQARRCEVPGLTPKQNSALTAEFAIEAARSGCRSWSGTTG